MSNSSITRLMVATCVLVAACASGSSRSAEQIRSLEASPIGTQEIVERSADSRPEWIVDPPEEEETYAYYSGGEEGYADFATGFRMAKAEAFQNIGESLLAFWNSLLQSSSIARPSSVDEYGRNFQELAVQELVLMGVETEERYYEKVAEKTDYGVEYNYNTFVLLKAPKQKLRDAQRRALRQLRERASQADDASAREFIDEAVERLDQIGP